MRIVGSVFPVSSWPETIAYRADASDENRELLLGRCRVAVRELRQALLIMYHRCDTITLRHNGNADRNELPHYTVNFRLQMQTHHEAWSENDVDSNDSVLTDGSYYGNLADDASSSNQEAL